MHRLFLALSIALAWLGVAKADQPPLPAAAPTIVAADAIGAKIATLLATRIPVAGRYHVSFADAALALTLPASAQGRYDIAALNFDPARQVFAASLSYVGANGQLQVTGVAGAAYAVVDVPAPGHDLAPGDVITATDLTTIELPAERVSTTL